MYLMIGMDSEDPVLKGLPALLSISTPPSQGIPEQGEVQSLDSTTHLFCSLQDLADHYFLIATPKPAADYHIPHQFRLFHYGMELRMPSTSVDGAMPSHAMDRESKGLVHGLFMPRAQVKQSPWKTGNIGSEGPGTLKG